MVRVVVPTADVSARLMAIERAAFAGREEPWVADDYAWLGTPPSGAIITDDTLSKGMIAVRFAADEGEIINLAVVPEARRNGLARLLLASAETLARELGVVRMYLEVAFDNTAARALYRSQRYIEVGERRDYYVRPDGTRMDALVLAKALDPGPDQNH